MGDQLTPADLRNLSVTERLRLLDAIWASLSDEDPGAIEVPDWHKAKLDARLAEHARDSSAARPWSEVKAEILDTLRK